MIKQGISIYTKQCVAILWMTSHPQWIHPVQITDSQNSFQTVKLGSLCYCIAYFPLQIFSKTYFTVVCDQAGVHFSSFFSCLTKISKPIATQLIHQFHAFLNMVSSGSKLYNAKLKTSKLLSTNQCVISRLISAQWFAPTYCRFHCPHHNF